jgi:hypothetical protein
VVDLSEVTLMSAAAIGVLIANAGRLASTGGQLLVATGNPDIRRLLRVTRADDVLDTHASVPEALAALRPRSHHPTCETDVALERLDLRGGETRGLRRRLHTQPTVARALGVLQERYGLRHAETAFELLRTSSQQHNLRLHLVAAAFLAAPPPRRWPDGQWFPGRLHHAAPRLTFAPRSVALGGNRTAVLDAVLDAVSDCMATDAVDLQMADVLPGSLYLERHRGLTAELLDFIDRDETTFTAPAAALCRRLRVVISDVATNSIITDLTERTVLLAGGSHALHSSPFPTALGRPIGVVTTHHPQPGLVLTPTQHARLDVITAEAGAWLDWHRRTVVLDALEHVHESARAIRGGRGD